MHHSRASADLGTSFDAKRKPLRCGQGQCVSHENDAAREEDRHLSGRCGRGRCAYRWRRRHGLVGIVGGQGADVRRSGLPGGELAGGRRWRLGGGRGIGTFRLALLLSLAGRSVLHELQSGTACKWQYKEVTYCTIGPRGQNFLALWHELLVSAALAARYLLCLLPAIPRLRASLRAVGIASSRVSGTSNSGSKSILRSTT